MPEFLNNFSAQFKALAPARQALLVGTAVVSLVFFFWITNRTNTAEFRVLYRGLEDAEVASIVDALTAERIDHRLEEGGTAIMVPAPMIHEARIRLASKGLPSSSAPGFELFENGAFGVTDFVQKINYRRALQGELARSIEQLEPIEKARVQIAIPEKTVFLRRDERKPSASIVTRLRPGWDLTSAQVRGIVHLVASSIEGMTVAQVTLVDDRGRLLAPQGDGPAGPDAPGGSLMQQARMEKQLEDRIVSILERTVGIGRVAAKVNAELDWTRTETTEEQFDPDSQVARSEQRSTDTSQDSAGAAGGVPGVRANAPDAVGGVGNGGNRSTNSASTTSTVNYEISKKVSHQVAPMGTVQRLSIAVLVDGVPKRLRPTAEGQAEEGSSDGFVEWETEQLEEFEQLAKRSVGFDPERGDEFTLTNAPFTTLDADDQPGWFDPQLIVLLTSALHGLAFLIGLILFARLFVKPLADAVKAAPGSLAGLTAGDLEAQLEGGLTSSGERMVIPGMEEDEKPLTLQEQVDVLAEARGEDSVKTIRGWLAS